MPAWIIQGLGYLGLIAFAVSYQTRSNKKLFLIQLLAEVLFVVQFALLGAWSGCISIALCGVRNFLLSQYDEWPWVRSKAVPVLFCSAFAAVTVFTWAGPKSLLALAAAVGSTLAYCTDNARTIRAANLFLCCPCWMVYDLIIGSWGGFFNETFTLVSIIVSIIRFGWKALGEKAPEKTAPAGK